MVRQPLGEGFRPCRRGRFLRGLAMATPSRWTCRRFGASGAGAGLHGQDARAPRQLRRHAHAGGLGGLMQGEPFVLAHRDQDFPAAHTYPWKILGPFERYDVWPWWPACTVSHGCRMTGVLGTTSAAAVGVAAAAYRRFLAPRLMTWGATDDEVAGPFPGGDFVPEGERGATMAVTIEAPAEQVWPWLVQMGWDRGGFYSWDLLDNAGRPSAREVHPEWQDLGVGDRLKCLGLPSYAVVTLEPNRFLGLYWLADLRGQLLDPSRPRPSAYMEGFWGFRLTELPGRRTRLVIGGYQAARPRWFERLMYDWAFPVVVWIMQARMLAVLKRNVERTASALSMA